MKIARLLVETEPRVRISSSTFLRRGVFVLLISYVDPFKGSTTHFQELVYPHRWVGGSSLLAVLTFKAPLTDSNRIFDTWLASMSCQLDDGEKIHSLLASPFNTANHAGAIPSLTTHPKPQRQ
jgi:hypothetical protein